MVIPSWGRGNDSRQWGRGAKSRTCREGQRTVGGGQRASRRGTSKRCWASWQVRGGGRDQQVVRFGGAGKKQGMGGRKHFDVMRFIGPSVRFQMKSVQRGPMLRDNTFLFEMFSIFTRSWSTRVFIRQGVGAAPSSSTGSHEVLARVSRPFRLRPAAALLLQRTQNSRPPPDAAL